MCPVYNADPSKDTAGFEVFPKGEYLIRIGEPKAFEKTGEKGTNFGVRYVCTIAEGPFKGKRFIQTCYQHTQEAKDFGKQFILAAAGFTKKQEDEFNSAAAGADWSFNTDNGAVGAAWRQLAGLHVYVAVSTKKGENDQEQQNIDSYRPVPAGTGGPVASEQQTVSASA